jgi:hypothetical protein
MRSYCFLECAKLTDLEKAGLKVLTPETAQRYAIQLQGHREEYPHREALLHQMNDTTWMVMPVTDSRDWVKILKELGLKVWVDVPALELEKPALVTEKCAVLDAEGKTTVARKLPVVIGNDDPVACAKAEAVEVPIDEKPIEEVVKR